MLADTNPGRALMVSSVARTSNSQSADWLFGFTGKTFTRVMISRPLSMVAMALLGGVRHRDVARDEIARVAPSMRRALSGHHGVGRRFRRNEATPESECLCERVVEHPRRKKSGQSPVLETLRNDRVARLWF